MAQPKSKEEYERRVMDNTKLTGWGMSTIQHLPCPFCGAPDLMTYRVIEVERVTSKGAECKECGRGMKTIFERNGTMTKMRMIQTKGDPPPPWVRGIECAP